MRRALHHALACGALAASSLVCANPALAQVEVSIPSADLSRGPGLMLKGFWFEAAASAPAPAVVLLHGCGGPYDNRGVLAQRMRD